MPEPLNIAVCEDNPAEKAALLAILSRSSIPNSCTAFPSGEAFLSAYRPQQFDLLLTDIYMGSLSGVDMVAKLRELDPELPVAFITGSTDFALEGYRLSVLRYIEKPCREEDIEDILRLARMKRDSAPALLLRKNGRERRIRFASILYLEQQTHELNLYLRDGSCFQVHEKLSSLSDRLHEAGFLVPHKSFAVNPAYVRGINSDLKCFTMADGKNVPIRRESMGRARQALRSFLMTRTKEIEP